MLSAEYRRDRWSVFGDWTYAHVTSEAPSPLGRLVLGRGGGPQGTHRPGGGRLPGLRRGGSAGGRVRRRALLQPESPARSANRPAGARTIETSPDWVDGIAGVRHQALLGDRWIPGVQVDIGTGGSNYSWQGIASLGYRVSWGEITGGWRTSRWTTNQAIRRWIWHSAVPFWASSSGFRRFDAGNPLCRQGGKRGQGQRGTSRSNIIVSRASPFP